MAAADHYEVLGLPRFAAASGEEVEAARETSRRLLAEWGDSKSVALAARVEEASRVLGDAVLREAYNSRLRRQLDVVHCSAAAEAVDHYELLGLPRFRATSVEEVEAALQSTLHLLAGWGDGQSVALVGRAEEAARVLSQPTLRQEYDAGLKKDLDEKAPPRVELDRDRGEES